MDGWDGWDVDRKDTKLGPDRLRSDQISQPDVHFTSRWKLWRELMEKNPCYTPNQIKSNHDI